MPFRFRTSRGKLAPRWLTEGEGGLLGYALDLVKDAFVERVRLGLMSHLPENDPNGTTTAPPDALVAMGRDRRVVKGIFETDSEYAARLRLWLDDRHRAGNPYMLMQKLAEYLGPLPSYRTVDARGNWYSRAADGTETALLKQENWDWDGTTIGERWSRFWVVIYPNGLWATESVTWGDGADSTWGEDLATDMLGITATQEQVVTVRHLVKDWKPAGTRCINTIVAFDPASFDPATPEPDGTWRGYGTVDAGVRVPARLATARYLGGTR